jgi:hypothetical protein
VIDLLSIASLVLVCMDATYLQLIIPHHNVLYKLVLAGCLGLVLLLFIMRNLKIAPQSLILLGAAGYVLLATLRGGGSLNAAFRMILAPTVLCLTLTLTKDRQEFHRVMEIWCAGLFALMCIDMLTMLAFPRGLYRTIEYTTNWFLGYKTVRLEYTLPLLSMRFFLDLEKVGRITRKTWIVAVLVTLDIARALATGGTVMVLLYIAMIVTVAAGYKQTRKQNRRSLLVMITRFPIFLGSYIAMFFVVVILPTTSFIQHLLVDYLHKSADFSGRVPIWIRTMKAAKEQLLFGHGFLLAQDYAKITRGFYNPHNTVFVYWLVGGLTGMVLLAWFMYFTVRSAETNRANLVFVFYLYVVLWLGLISAVMAFSPFLLTLIYAPVCYNTKSEELSAGTLRKWIMQLFAG